MHVSTEAILVGGRPIQNVDETFRGPSKSVGPYAATKKLGEEIALAANGPHMATVVVRPRMVWVRAHDPDPKP